MKKNIRISLQCCSSLAVCILIFIIVVAFSAYVATLEKTIISIPLP